MKEDGWLKRGVRGLKRGMEPEDENQDESLVARKKKRFRAIVAFGVVMSLVAFLVSISISSGGIIPVSEALASLASAIQKGGQNLDPVENYIYYSRLPRAIAAVAVGAGLAIAGCMFQAIIRNPLVDPYITGVSSGAGCLAIAVSAAGVSIPFIDANSLYIIPIAAIVGGLIAFAITMTVAEGSGGSTTNYILAGVIVGFAFSSVQTIFLTLDKGTSLIPCGGCTGRSLRSPGRTLSWCSCPPWGYLWWRWSGPGSSTSSPWERSRPASWGSTSGCSRGP